VWNSLCFFLVVGGCATNKPPAALKTDEIYCSSDYLPSGAAPPETLYDGGFCEASLRAYLAANPGLEILSVAPVTATVAGGQPGTRNLLILYYASGDYLTAKPHQPQAVPKTDASPRR
jgi:hypothetical protein